MSELIFDGPNGLVMLEDGYEFDALAPPVRREAPHTSSEDTEPPAELGPLTRTTSTKPEEVGWDEWHRRADAIRTMAREMEDLDHGDIREFVVGRTTRELSDDEVGQLRHDVIAHRVSDITDILDEQLRSGSERWKRARRTVRVQAPRGWVKRTFNTLDERAVGQVAARLLQRGYDPDTIKEKVVSRMKDEEARQRVETALDAGKLQIEFAQVPDTSVLPEPNPAADLILAAADMIRANRSE